MTAFAIEYLDNRLTVASDSLAYSGGERLGYLSKIAVLPHLRAVFLARGHVALIAGAVARLFLSPQAVSIEDAADTLPAILRDVTADFCRQHGIGGDTSTLDVLHCILAGWSESAQRMRLWQLLSHEDYRPHVEFDTAYGGVHAFPRVPAEYTPSPRASLDENLIRTLREVDRFCVEHPDVAYDTRLGGDIVRVQVTDRRITTATIGTIEAPARRK